MDYSDETMKHATFYTDLFKNFFLQTKSILLRPTTKRQKKFGTYEIIFFEYFEKNKLIVFASFKNNIDTPTTIIILHELVGSIITYVTTVESSELYASEEIIKDTVRYVNSILVMFGLDEFNKTNHQDNGSKEKLLKVIQELSQNLYTLTDKVRDQIKNLGHSLTDK